MWRELAEIFSRDIIQDVSYTPDWVREAERVYRLAIDELVVKYPAAEAKLRWAYDGEIPDVDAWSWLHNQAPYVVRILEIARTNTPETIAAPLLRAAGQHDLWQPKDTQAINACLDAGLVEDAIVCALLIGS